jgi:hypothetical protein
MENAVNSAKTITRDSRCELLNSQLRQVKKQVHQQSKSSAPILVGGRLQNTRRVGVSIGKVRIAQKIFHMTFQGKKPQSQM